MNTVSTYLAGAAQQSRHEIDTALHPALAMAQMTRAALADAGIDDTGVVDALACVEPLSWTYEDLPAAVAADAGLKPDIERFWVPAGGTSPLDLLHTIGERMAAGEIHCAVICGAESMRTRRRAARSGEELPWPERADDVNPMRGQAPFTSELERAHGLAMPIQVFPLFENALRTKHGRTADEQADYAATLLAKNARIAAANPHAWFRDAPSAAKIGAVTDDNRMVVYPYTKRMNAIMDVDQAAAVVVVSRQFAESSGLLNRCVAVLGGAGAEEIWNPIERNTFDACPAMAVATETALQRAGLEPSDLDALDLYSCFPSAIELALDALDIDADRPLSLTGGLAFAGGPGNAYVLHSLAESVERIRNAPAARLMVTGIGMANTKHAATVLTGAGRVPDAATGLTSYRERREETPREVEAEPTGSATVCAWTVEYGRDGAPVNAILLLDLEDGGRTIANMRDAARAAGALLTEDPTGRRGRVEHDPETARNWFELA